MVDKIRIRRQAGTPNERETETTLDDVVKDVGSNVEWIPGNTLNLTDKHQGRMLAFSDACMVTVPTGLRAGFSCGWLQAGTGVVTIAPGAGVSMNSIGNNRKSAGQWSMGGISAIDAEIYLLYGGLVA
ncbi:hypothetical protein RHIZ_03780 [Rhizobium skierniewicense]|uniref:hypothetical protein n=1 Tax=Rhizobium skierniewicense TaxID=984260 RepID=UPI001FACC571|nr:hypothetical protein [Rhizobium skierniewicense]MCI9865061.1 hypothetical protein [Rhizobium skierniewicense]